MSRQKPLEKKSCRSMPERFTQACFVRLQNMRPTWSISIWPNFITIGLSGQYWLHLKSMQDVLSFRSVTATMSSGKNFIRLYLSVFIRILPFLSTIAVRQSSNCTAARLSFTSNKVEYCAFAVMVCPHFNPQRPFWRSLNGFSFSCSGVLLSVGGLLLFR